MRRSDSRYALTIDEAECMRIIDSIRSRTWPETRPAGVSLRRKDSHYGNQLASAMAGIHVNEEQANLGPQLSIYGSDLTDGAPVVRPVHGWNWNEPVWLRWGQ